RGCVGTNGTTATSLANAGVYTGNYFVIIVVDTITIGACISKWQAVVINIIYGGTVQRVPGRNHLSSIV
ncbi:MAG: hypothetical protein COU64_06085, partial [Candidatus Pacebacteria bacterium CG10_big_fil_rev_8_21_14_0_10_40_26]